jgi:hypothetical protein
MAARSSALIDPPMTNHFNPIASFLSAALPDHFSFLVNDTSIYCDLSEALVLSPIVREQLSIDACARQFTFGGANIKSSDLSLLQQLILGKAELIETYELNSFESLCRELGNSDLEMLFFSRIFRMTHSGFDLDSADICSLSFEALDLVLSNADFSVASEDAFLELVLNLGLNYRGLLRHVHVRFLSPDWLLLLASQFITPSELIWSAIPYWIKPQLDSLILCDFPIIFDRFRTKQFKLLWRGSRDGFEASDFHFHCDDHANTVTVILDTDGNVFGGFTPVAWKSCSFRDGAMSGNPLDCVKSDESLTSFIFTLKNPFQTPPMIFGLKAECKDLALWMHKSCGPSFGSGEGGCDICVSDRCNSADATSSTDWFGSAYTTDVKIDGVVHMAELLTGYGIFIVSEIEVFEITE